MEIAQKSPCLVEGRLHMKDKRVSIIYGEGGLFTFELCPIENHWYYQGEDMRTYFIGRLGQNKDIRLFYHMTNDDLVLEGSLEFEDKKYKVDGKLVDKPVWGGWMEKKKNTTTG